MAPPSFRIAGGVQQPARGFRIEFSQALQRAIFFFRQNLDPHGGGHVHGAGLRLEFFPGLQRLPVIADVPAVFWRFRRTIIENDFARLWVVPNHIRLAAAVFHLVERPHFFRLRFQPGLHLGPVKPGMARHVLLKAGFQACQQRLPFFCRQRLPFFCRRALRIGLTVIHAVRYPLLSKGDTLRIDPCGCSRCHHFTPIFIKFVNLRHSGARRHALGRCEKRAVRDYNPPMKNILLIALIVACILLVLLVTMQFNDEMDWGLFDFVIAGVLLFGAGLAFSLVARQAQGIVYRAAVGAALGTALLLVWVNIAVGVIGSEDNPANLMYIAVLAVLAIGALLVRFRAHAMAGVLVATALAQALVAVIALLSEAPPEAAEILMVNGFFIALWLGSALLFWRAGAALKRQPV